MQKAKVLIAQRLSHMPNQERGAQPVIQITTDLPKGGNNSFYIDLVDLKGVPIKTAFDHAPSDTVDPTEINAGDVLEFDLQDGLMHKAVLWKGRKIRQREYSFDCYTEVVGGAEHFGMPMG